MAPTRIDPAAVSTFWRLGSSQLLSSAAPPRSSSQMPPPAQSDRSDAPSTCSICTALSYLFIALQCPHIYIVVRLLQLQLLPSARSSSKSIHPAQLIQLISVHAHFQLDPATRELNESESKLYEHHYESITQRTKESWPLKPNASSNRDHDQSAAAAPWLLFEASDDFSARSSECAASSRRDLSRPDTTGLIGERDKPAEGRRQTA